MVYRSAKEQNAKTNFVRRRAEAPRIHNARGQRKDEEGARRYHPLL
jgi:hypothetical protein